MVVCAVLLFMVAMVAAFFFSGGLRCELYGVHCNHIIKPTLRPRNRDCRINCVPCEEVKCCRCGRMNYSTD